VLLLSGSLHSVLTAIFLILEKISRDATAAAARGIKKADEAVSAAPDHRVTEPRRPLHGCPPPAAYRLLRRQPQPRRQHVQPPASSRHSQPPSAALPAPVCRGPQGQAQVKLALSRRLCGLLIGHKGQTVRGCAGRPSRLPSASPRIPCTC
jgi:hypothetical protein